MILGYILLAVSTGFEVLATSMLPSTRGFTRLKPTIIVLIMYTICFAAFGKCLLSLNLGIAWATWGAVGTVVTPIAGYLLYKQRLSKLGVLGLILIIVSTVSLNLYG